MTVASSKINFEFGRPSGACELITLLSQGCVRHATPAAADLPWAIVDCSLRERISEAA
jgi:hypothetical protein